jgi:hypothetical protein
VAALEAILKLVNTMIAGQLPHLDSFLDSNLIAVEKPQGGWHPTHRRWQSVSVIAGLGAMAARPAANASLPPLQLGVGARRGTEATGHALQTALASDPELQLVCIDFQTSYNTTLGYAILQAVAHCAPELLAYVLGPMADPPASGW